MPTCRVAAKPFVSSPVTVAILSAQSANPANPANPVPEFVAWAKTQGDKLSYGSVGNGSSSHLTMELFKASAGIDAVHVPYAGSPPAATSLASGETQALFAVEPALRELFAEQGLIAGGGTPAEFKSFVEAEGKKWGAIIKRVGITTD